jgi:hypothetical protein
VVVVVVVVVVVEVWWDRTCSGWQERLRGRSGCKQQWQNKRG